MIIKIDIRETGLIEKCNARIDLSEKLLPNLQHLKMKRETLDLGDISFHKSGPASGPASGPELVIIERKTISDLYSSIKDGRYNEQSYRLRHYGVVPNHNIYYLIEGNIKSSKYSPAVKRTIYSAITSLSLFKGFSIIRTYDVDETVEFILAMANKIGKETEVASNGSQKSHFYHIPSNIAQASNPAISEPTVGTSECYSTVVKKRKKDNITGSNIGIIFLSQIPGLSSVSAQAIMSNYSSIVELIDAIKLDESCMKDITYKTAKGQERHVSAPAIKNVIAYLFNNATK
jgi:ERCC4-type nuclease